MRKCFVTWLHLAQRIPSGQRAFLMNSKQAPSSGKWALNCLMVYFFIRLWYHRKYVMSRDNSPNIITMVGLAAGIDCSLFIVSRFREERARGLDKVDAIAAAGATASRAVFFSGMIVILGWSAC